MPGFHLGGEFAAFTVLVGIAFAAGAAMARDPATKATTSNNFDVLESIETFPLSSIVLLQPELPERSCPHASVLPFYDGMEYEWPENQRGPRKISGAHLIVTASLQLHRTYGVNWLPVYFRT